MEGPPSEDLATTVLTCKGDLRDPSFPLVLHKLVCKLEALLKSGKKPFRVTKVEPWNSVRVTFNIPREAAHRLRLLAERGDTALRELGILSVQIEGDQIITLTLASGFGDKQNLVLTNKPATEGASSSSSTSSTSSSGVAVATGVLPAAIAGASGLAVNRDTATPATANCKPGSTTPPLTSATLSCNNSNNTSNNATSTIASSATSSHFPSASASVALRVDSVSLSGSKQQGYAHHSGVVNNILDNLKTKNAQYLSHGPSTSSTFKSPNVIAPQSSGPLPFVTSSSSSTNSTLLSSVASSSPSTNSNSNTSANIVRNVPGPTSTAPNVGPFPFASMQHAMHTKQGTSTSSVHPSSTQQTLLNTTTTTSVVSTTDTLNAAFIRNPNVFNNVVKNSLLTTSTATTTVPTVIKQQAQNVSMAVGHGASCNSVMTVSAAGNVCSGVSSSAIASATTTTTTSSSASSSVALTSPLLVNLLQSDGSGSHLKMMPPPPPPLQPQQTPPVTNATPVVAAATGITLPTPLASTSITGEAVPKRSKQRKPRKVKDKPPDEGTKQGPGIVVVTSLSAPTPVVVTTGVSVAQISNKIQNHPLPSTTTAVSATPTIATTTTTTTTASTTVQPMVQSSVVKSTSQSSKPQSLGVHSHHFINIPTGTMPRYPSIHPEAQGQPQVATSGQLPLRHQQPPLLTTPTVAPTQSQFNHVGSPQVAVPPPPPPPSSPSQSLQRPPALQSMVATLAPSGMNGPQVESLIHQSSTQITRSSPALTTSVAPVVSSSLPPSNALLSTGPQQQQQDGGKTKHLINPFTGHLEPMMSDDEDEDRHSAIDFPELEQGGAVSGLGLGLGSVVPHSRPCEQLIAESLKDNNNHSDTDSGFGKSTTDASSQSPLEISSLDPVTLVDPLPTVNEKDEVTVSSSPKTTVKSRIRVKRESKSESADGGSLLLSSNRSKDQLRKLSAHSAPELLEPSAVSSLIAEPRVPPLHISLRGPNAVVLQNRRESADGEKNDLAPTPLLTRKPRSRATRAMSAESTLAEDTSYSCRNQKRKLQREQRFLSGGGIIESGVSKSVSPPTLMQVDVLKTSVFPLSSTTQTTQEIVCSALTTTTLNVQRQMCTKDDSKLTRTLLDPVRSPPNCAQKSPSATDGNLISCEINVPDTSSSSSPPPPPSNITKGINSTNIPPALPPTSTPTSPPPPSRTTANMSLTADPTSTASSMTAIGSDKAPSPVSTQSEILQTTTGNDTSSKPHSSENNIANHSNSLSVVNDKPESNHLSMEVDLAEKPIENNNSHSVMNNHHEKENLESVAPNTSILTIKDISDVINEESKLLKNEAEADSQEMPPLIASSEIFHGPMLEEDEESQQELMPKVSETEKVQESQQQHLQQQHVSEPSEVSKPDTTSSHLPLPDSSNIIALPSTTTTTTTVIGNENNDLASCEESSLDSSTAPTENVSYTESSDEVSQSNCKENDLEVEKSSVHPKESPKAETLIVTESEDVAIVKENCSPPTSDMTVIKVTDSVSELTKALSPEAIEEEPKIESDLERVQEAVLKLEEKTEELEKVSKTEDEEKKARTESLPLTEGFAEVLTSSETAVAVAAGPSPSVVSESSTDLTKPLQIMITSSVPSLETASSTAFVAASPGIRVATTSSTSGPTTSSLLAPAAFETSSGRFLILKSNLNSPSASSGGTSGVVSGDRLSPVGLKPIKLVTLAPPSSSNITVRTAANKLAQIINSSCPNSPLSPNSTVCPISSSTTATAVSTGSPPVRFLIPKAGPSGTVSVGSNPGFNIVVKSVMVTNPTPSVKIVSNQEAPAALSTVSSSSLLIPFPSTTSITTTQAEATSSTTTVVDTTSKSLDEKAAEEIVLKENNDIIEEKPEDEQAANILVLNDEVIKDRNNNDGHDSSGTEESDIPNLEPISLSIPAQEHLVSSSEEPLMPDIISGGSSNLLIGPSSVTITLGGSPPSNGPSDTEDSMSSNDGKRHSVASGDHNYTSVKSLLKESVDDDETEEVIIEDQEVDEGKTDSESNSMLSPNLVSIVEKTNSRPSKRKSSENAAERIKAYMDYEDVPRKSIYTGINVTPSNSVTSITIRSRSESSEASDLTISNNRGETVTVTPHELNSFATKTSVVKNATPKLRKRKLTTTSNNNNNTTSGTPTEAITVVVDHHSASSEEDESLDDSKSWRNKTRLRQSSTKPESVTGPGRPPSAKAKRNCKDNTKKDVKTKKAPVKRKGREVTNSVTTQRSSTRRTTRDHNNIALPPVAPADESVTTIVVNDTETVEIIEDSEEEIIIPSMPQSTSTNAAAATTTTTVITTGGSLTNHVFEEATAASPTVVSATNASSGLSLLNKRKTRTIVSNETNDVSCITTTNTTTTSKRRKINKDGHR